MCEESYKIKHKCVANTLKMLNFDAFLFVSEVNRFWISGIKVSEGLCLVTKKSTYLIVDSRYYNYCKNLKFPEGINLVKGEYNSDPSSVAYDGMVKAKKENIDLVIVDVSGRLQTKQYLMDELSKLNRVIGKVIPDAPHETFLIIDATTGQNGVVQAKAFAEVTTLTGVVITKMDGTSKGGIILAIRDELGVPVRFIGLGEKMDDLKEFDLESYIYGLCVEK